MATDPVAPVPVSAPATADPGPSQPLREFYRRWYRHRPADQWPVSDLHVAGYPVTPLSMFAALNFAIATTIVVALKRSPFGMSGMGIRTVDSLGTVIPHPEDVFMFAGRWVTQCLVTRSGHSYVGGQSPFASAWGFTQLNYRVGDGIDALLPAEYVALLYPFGGLQALQEAVNEAFQFDWWHRRQEELPPGATDRAEWSDPLGTYYTTRILR